MSDDDITRRIKSLSADIDLLGDAINDLTRTISRLMLENSRLRLELMPDLADRPWLGLAQA